MKPVSGTAQQEGRETRPVNACALEHIWMIVKKWSISGFKENHTTGTLQGEKLEGVPASQRTVYPQHLTLLTLISFAKNWDCMVLIKIAVPGLGLSLLTESSGLGLGMPSLPLKSLHLECPKVGHSVPILTFIGVT